MAVADCSRQEGEKWNTSVSDGDKNKWQGTERELLLGTTKGPVFIIVFLLHFRKNARLASSTVAARPGCCTVKSCVADRSNSGVHGRSLCALVAFFLFMTVIVGVCWCRCPIIKKVHAMDVHGQDGTQRPVVSVEAVPQCGTSLCGARVTSVMGPFGRRKMAKGSKRTLLEEKSFAMKGEGRK